MSAGMCVFEGRWARAVRGWGWRESDVLMAANNLGMLLMDMRRWDEGEALLVEALAGNTATLGEGHPNTRETAASLEELRRRRGGARGR